MSSGYLQFTRNSEEIELFRLRPSAFLLLALIAQRAKRTEDHPNKDLEIGEALIGDWEKYATSREIYRNDIKFLIKHQKATIRTTTKGTIARIVTTSPFNISEEIATTTLTIKPPSSHHQATTNKNVKNDKNTYIYEEILNHYNQTTNRKTKFVPKGSVDYWMETYTLDEIKGAITNIPLDDFWKDKMDLTTLFRIKNQNHEDVDWIGRLLNKKASKPEYLKGIRPANQK